MNSPIEYQGRPVISLSDVPAGATVTVCAWCANDRTAEARSAGLEVSHGMCRRCSKFFEQPGTGQLTGGAK